MPWVDGRWEGELPTIEELAANLEGDPLECDCCGSRGEGVDLTVYSLSLMSHQYEMNLKEDLPPVKVLCTLCSITLTGSHWEYYPRQEYKNLQIMQMICTVGNEIIKEIRKLKP